MCNLQIITKYPTGKTVKQKTFNEMCTRGFSHLFSDEDFKIYYKLHLNKCRRSGNPLQPSWAAVEIVEAMLLDYDTAQSDFKEYLF